MKKKSSIFELVIIVLIIGITLYVNYSNTSKADESANKVLSENTLEVHFIDVGQADSILIRCSEDNVLIDAGNNEDGDMLVKYFKSHGIDSFKYVFGTHAHEDHIGGMDEVIDNFNIGTFYMPSVMTTTKTFEDVLDSLEAKNYYFDTPKIGDTLSVCDSELRVVYVGNDESDLNSTSIVLKLTHGNNSFLFTGDATSSVEKEILSNDIRADVLKVAHHGSKYSTTATFLKKVNPKYAVISVGADNSYGHPGDAVINRLDKMNVKTYRTDLNGTIVMESDGNVLKVKTEK